MQKRVIVTCRPQDPPGYSGEFEVEAEFVFRARQGTERELRLSDGRVIYIKPIGRRYTVFDKDHFRRCRTHKIINIEFLYQPVTLEHARRRVVRR